MELDGKPNDAALRAIAESVQPVPLERWQTLVVATSPAPNTPPAGSKAVVVRRSGGATLTALLPPGFPVAPEDERLPCFRLRFRGDSATECARHPTWERLGGAVYVFGIVSPRVRNVRVVAEDVGSVTVPAVRARGYGLARFYAARLPTNTCEVRDPQRADGPGHRPVRPGREPLDARQAALPNIKRDSPSLDSAGFLYVRPTASQARAESSNGSSPTPRRARNSRLSAARRSSSWATVKAPEGATPDSSGAHRSSKPV